MMALGPSTRPGRCAARGRHAGQATLEFIVLALVLVPLLLAVPLLGKMIDLMQSAEAASRYAAFEGTTRNTSSTWKADAELAGEVRRRFFSRTESPVKTNDVPGDFAADRNPLWTDPAGRPLLDRYADQVGVRTQIAGLNPIASALFSDSLDLPKDNLYTATVTVEPVDIAGFEPWGALGLSISRKTVLLADAWTARDPAAVRSRIEGATAVYPAQKAHLLFDAVGAVPTLLRDPALRIGEFDWDVVPCDRLIGGC